MVLITTSSNNFPKIRLLLAFVPNEALAAEGVAVGLAAVPLVLRNRHAIVPKLINLRKESIIIFHTHTVPAAAAHIFVSPSGCAAFHACPVD